MISTELPQVYLNNPGMATKETVDQFFTFYLTQTKLFGTIRIAFKRVCEDDSLFYGIVLKKDNLPNRSVVSEFLILYHYLPISQDIPVFFQYMPEDAVKSFKKIEIIP